MSAAPPTHPAGAAKAWDVESQTAAAPCAAGDAAEGAVPATLSWRSLSVTVRDNKGAERHILKSVEGLVEPRHMLAIMGPSGCGKSTLLDTLAGRLASSAAWEGEIRVNGRKAALSYGGAAYVTQVGAG